MLKKITYWLRKLGISRTNVTIAKNNKKLNELNATNGGIIQSQQEIDRKYKPQK